MELKLLDEAGVATVSGASFGEFGEGYLRLSYANSLENIEEALERITNCLGAAKSKATSSHASA
jgi:aspartate/methionine/tyrosine aminotransferase